MRTRRYCPAAASIWACCVLPFVADAQEQSNWHFFGTTGLDKHVGDILFYSSTDLVRLPNGHLQVWAKALNAKVLNKAALSKEALNRAVTKVLRDDIAFGKVQPLTPDEKDDLAAYEELANQGEISAHVKVLYELDCASRMVRTLSVIVEEHGSIRSNDSVAKWSHTAPETNGAALTALLCPRQQ